LIEMSFLNQISTKKKSKKNNKFHSNTFELIHWMF
jgi:hypothetical protein